MNMKTRALLCLVLAMAVLVGCRRGTLTDVQRDPNGGVDATFRMTEAEANDAISEALANSGNPLLRNPKVDLQPGQIVVNGERDTVNSGGRVSGSLTLTLTAQNGALLAQVTKADIDGVPLTDQRIQQFNQRLQDGFNRRANRDNKQITFQSVMITDSDIQITFNAKR
jgi:hypothetical protein